MASRLKTPLFVSAASANSAATNSITITKPASTASGDVLVAVMSAYESADNLTWTGASGWTERADQTVNPNLRIATLTAGGSEPANYTFTSSGSVPYLSGAILCLRGAVYDTIGGSFSTMTGNGTLAISGITTTGYALLIAAVTTGGSSTHTQPFGFGMVEIANWPSKLSVYTKLVSVGATGNVSVDVSNTSDSSAGVLVSVKAS